MSTIYNALSNWLQRQNVSVMRQAMLTANATEQEHLELELAELRKLTRCKVLEKCPDPRWKLIRDETMEYKGDTFNRKLWVAVCGGSVEYTEGLSEGKRTYQVERFELKPVSWAKEKALAWPCSHIVSDTYDTQEGAMERVDFHKESIIPFWWKVKSGNASALKQLPVEEYERKIRERPKFGEIPTPTPTPEPTICDAFPPNTQEQMIAISIDSASKIREMGAAITHDYTLGRVFTGTEYKVLLPRPEGTIGTYHTHPFGAPFPSITDTLEAMSRNDRLMCIGSSGKPGTKIQCFTPNKPKWDDLQFKFRLLMDDIKDYNKKLGKKYMKSGTILRRLLEGVGSPRYLEKIEYVTPEELKEEVVRTSEIAKMAEETARIAVVEANTAAEAVNVAQVKFNKAVTEVEKKEAMFNVRTKEDEARRATARIVIERGLTINARATADEAAFKANVMSLGKAEAIAANRDAAEHLREGSDLAKRRDTLSDGIRAQIRELAAPKEWKSPKWTNGFTDVPFFEAHPNMLNKCRIIWETMEEEELPYEL